MTMVAVSMAGPVGVDVELTGPARFDNLSGVVLHPHEAPMSADDLATVWVRKEALLKALGLGLAVDPRSIWLSAPGSRPTLLRWEAAGPPARQTWMFDLDVPTSYVASLSVIGDEQPSVSVQAEAAGGRS